MAKIELKTEELVDLLRRMQGNVPGMGQEAPRRSAEESLGMIQALRAARPVESLVAAGTPTQRRREEVAQTLFQQERMAQEAALEREEMAQRAVLEREQMALDERLAAAARAATRAAQTAIPVTPQGIHMVAGTIAEIVDMGVRHGSTFADVRRVLEGPEALQYYYQFGVRLEDVLELAKSYYGHGLQSPLFGEAITGGQQPFQTPAQPQPWMPQRTLDFLNPQQRRQESVGIERQRRLDAARRDWEMYRPSDRLIEPGLYQRPDGTYYRVDDEAALPITDFMRNFR